MSYEKEIANGRYTVSRLTKRVKRAIKVIRWKWRHRDERPCVQRKKRMLREIDGVPQRYINLV